MGWRSRRCDGTAGHGTGCPFPADGRGRHCVLYGAASRSQTHAEESGSATDWVPRGTALAVSVREAILEDGKLQSTILDVVCSCQI